MISKKSLWWLMAAAAIALVCAAGLFAQAGSPLPIYLDAQADGRGARQ